MTQQKSNRTPPLATQTDRGESLHPNGMDGGWVGDVRRWVENNNRREQHLAQLEKDAAESEPSHDDDEASDALPGERSAQAHAMSRDFSERGAA